MCFYVSYFASDVWLNQLVALVVSLCETILTLPNANSVLILAISSWGFFLRHDGLNVFVFTFPPLRKPLKQHAGNTKYFFCILWGKKNLISLVKNTDLKTLVLWSVHNFPLNCFYVNTLIFPVFCLQSSVSGSPDSADHWHVHLQGAVSDWRQTAAEGYSQQRLQKQVSACPETALKNRNR